MDLSDVPPGEPSFLDANILIYHFAGASRQCSEFLHEVETGARSAWMGDTVLLEVLHRLLLIEAAEEGEGLGSNPAKKLSKRPDAVRQLSKYHFSVKRIRDMGISALRLPKEWLERSHEFRQSHGLLSNDSLIPMYMREVPTTVLISSDAAFDRVPWIKRFAPSDLPS